MLFLTIISASWIQSNALRSLCVPKKRAYTCRMTATSTSESFLNEKHQSVPSPRLIKAQKLLMEFQMTSPFDADDQEESTEEKDLQQQDLSESFWTNGHLLEGTAGSRGSYVTRWKKGVKVAEPLVKYDPISAEKLLFRQPAKWLIRNVQIAVPLGLWVGGVLWDIATQQEEKNRRNRAKQLLNTLTTLGPAIIKGGQALASRPDLMPSEYLEELQKLQDDVPTFSNKLAFATVEEELSLQSFSDVFELIEPEPVAAASLGQVYRAKLLSNGDIVALKIQRPDCEQIIALDLYVLRWWSGVATAIMSLLQRDINVQMIIDDFGEIIYRELDYVAELANAQRFAELYAAVNDVFVPKVYSELTTSKVLTMEWVDGYRLSDPNLETYGLDRKKLVDILIQCSLRQILENGFFHADPHAGNLLARPDGRLCYLDFGMMSYASKAQRNGFLLAVVHIVNRDWSALVRLYQRLGFIPEGTDLKPIEQGLEAALPDVLNADVSELNFKNVIGKLGDIMYTYPFSLPPFYIAIIRCLGVLEGLAIQVDPKARVISAAYPYVASRVLTDPQDDLQEALRRLALSSDGHIRWDRLEGLLEKAKESSGYDVTAAIDQLTDYLLSADGENLLNEVSDEIVNGADSLSSDSLRYVIDAFRALSIKDEVEAVKAFRALQSLLASSSRGVDAVQEELQNDLRKILPEPTVSMAQFWNIASLLGAQGANADPAKYAPLIRKLAQEPRFQRAASEIVARLGERWLSRSLRGIFGLPAPSFENKERQSDIAKSVTV